MINRRQALKALLTASPALAVIDAFFIEPKLLTTTRRELYLPELPAGLDGLKVAHLTDFHYDPEHNHRLLEKVTHAVAAEQVDLVALTGDFIDSERSSLPPLVEHLSKLEAKLGVYACLGNHDGWNASHSYFKQHFKKANIDLLINQHSQLTIAGESLYLAATDFVWHGSANARRTLRGIPKQSPIVSLVHEPDYFDNMKAVRPIMLQLSGHTHGGQCRVPFIGYAPQRVSYGRNYLYDHYRVDKSQIFVSRGVGTTGIRVRFACPPELAILTLRAGNPPS